MAEIPYNINIELPSGDDRTLPVTIANADGSTDADYSSWTVFFTVTTTKDAYDTDANAVYQLKSTDASSRISNTASGSPLTTSITVNHFAREAADKESTPLAPGNYYYDLQLVSPAGVVQTWQKGLYKVKWHSTVDVS